MNTLDYATSTTPRRKDFAVLWILLLTLIFLTAARTLFGGKLLLHHDLASRLLALTQWRDLDSFGGWIAILILAFADQFAGGRARKITPFTLAAGLALLAASILFPDFSPTLDLAAAACLAATGAILGLRQLSQITKSQHAGVTIDQLWRLVAVQWMLVWVAAELYLRIKFRKDGLTDKSATELLFALPAFGLTPNVLMALGLQWWRTLRPQVKDSPINTTRPRAWLVALLAYNLGALCLVAGGFGDRMRGIALIGAAPLLLGLAMYLLGFGKNAWTAGKLVPLAFITLALGVILFLGERFLSLGALASMEYVEGWRLLLGGGVAILWLAGMGSLAEAACVPERLRSRGTREAASIANALLVLGLALASIMLLLGGDWIEGVGSGALMQLIGVALAAALTLRGARSLRS